MLAGSFGLSEFTDLRVKKREEKARLLTAEEAQIFRKKNSKPESLDSLFEVYILYVLVVEATFYMNFFLMLAKGKNITNFRAFLILLQFRYLFAVLYVRNIFKKLIFTNLSCLYIYNTTFTSLEIGREKNNYILVFLSFKLYI